MPTALANASKSAKKAQKTNQKPEGNGSAKQPIEKQSPPPRPNISGYRTVEPTLHSLNRYNRQLKRKTSSAPLTEDE
ncbi:hypothetical protein NPIL_233811 [Nephila pilipes]|uniref:Uncharacterized protein n=1 Tax=Nephila pilipes TaxID=299642 RepID=A0A8X6PGH3_NEPPI|nr:hypothetical protein NPIL_233811 [Nephila pilipes]